jgi:hypothetical protein
MVLQKESFHNRERCVEVFGERTARTYTDYGEQIQPVPLYGGGMTSEHHTDDSAKS